MEGLQRSVNVMELSEFRNLGPHLPTTEYSIPESAENRHPTDRAFLIVFVLCVILLMPFLFYTLYHSDIGRFTGYDDCGNVCGSKNAKDERWNCTGQDFTNKKYWIIGKGCVEECGVDYKEIDEICIPNDLSINPKDLGLFDWRGLVAYIFKGTIIFRIVVSVFWIAAVSFAVLCLFRYSMSMVVWGIIIGSILLGVLLLTVMWVEYADEDAAMDDTVSFIVCIACTFFLLVYILTIYFGRAKIRMVTLLLSQATLAIFTIPSLVILPVYTFCVDTTIFITYLVTTIYMLSAGTLTESPYSEYLGDRVSLVYKMTGVMSWTIFYNTVIYLWASYFISGLQYMVIGGAVSEWYFAKDKFNLHRPIRRSFSVAYRFHLGTIAFGSLIITLSHIVRRIIKGLSKNRLTKCLVAFCLNRVEALLQFVSERAYIVTAMHGQPFMKSGKRAVTLMTANLGEVLAHILIVRLIMGAVVFLIAVLSVLLSMMLFIPNFEDEFLPAVLLLIYVMAVFAGIIFSSLIKTTTDTIFICFCEDKMINDGIERPYAMSQELMEFVDNAKKANTTETGKNYTEFDEHYVKPEPV